MLATFPDTSVIYDIAIDSKDNLWCFGYGGLAVYNGKELFVDDSTFNNTGVFVIEQTPENTIWIGTGDGIYRNDWKDFILMN